MTSRTSQSSSPQVRLSDHALDRARQRYSELRHLSHSQLASKLCAEVGDALRSGRKAKTAPRFATLDGDARHKINGSSRYVWTRDSHRVFIVKPSEGCYVVLTTLATVTSRP